MNDKKLGMIRLLKQFLFLALVLMTVKLISGFLYQALYIFVAFWIWAVVNNLLAWIITRKTPAFIESAKEKAKEQNCSMRTIILKLAGGFSVIAAAAALFLALIF